MFFSSLFFCDGFAEFFCHVVYGLGGMLALNVYECAVYAIYVAFFNGGQVVVGGGGGEFAEVFVANKNYVGFVGEKHFFAKRPALYVLGYVFAAGKFYYIVDKGVASGGEVATGSKSGYVIYGGTGGQLGQVGERFFDFGYHGIGAIRAVGELRKGLYVKVNRFYFLAFGQNDDGNAHLFQPIIGRFVEHGCGYYYVGIEADDFFYVCV